MLIFLVFHKIQEHSGGDIHAISPNNFLKQLLMIQRGGLPILDPNILSDPKSYYRDGIIFTFDDGTSDHYQIVRPLLNEYGIRGIFYVSTARLDRDRYITQQQVRSLWEDGHVIGSHSHSHKRMDLMSSREVKNELKLSADIIHNIIGLDPVHFAPPGGFYNRNVQETARSLGYSSCRTMDWGYNRSFDPMCIEVVPITAIFLSSIFLRAALHGKWEGILKSLYHLKNVLRVTLTESGYIRFRRSFGRTI